MNPRPRYPLLRFPLLALLLALTGLSARVHAQGPRAGGKLNVLFLISDDLNERVGCLQDKDEHQPTRTPNIDALAARGVRFDHAYCQYPLCNPSRTSFLTGLRPTSTGVMVNQESYRDTLPNWKTLPEYFKENGYVTARVGKVFHDGQDPGASAWTESDTSKDSGAAEDVHDPAVGLGDMVKEAVQNGPKGQGNRRPNGGNGPGRNQGGNNGGRRPGPNNDRWGPVDAEGEKRLSDFGTGEKGIALLRKYSSRAFFIAIGFRKPHVPLLAPQRHFDGYDPAKVVLPVDFHPSPRVNEDRRVPEAAVRNNFDLFATREATETLAREATCAYQACISYMDEQVGNVLGELEKLGHKDDTIVVFIGDHGFHLGEKGMWSKRTLFEVCARAPVIVSWPGVTPPAARCQRVVEFIDLYPTLVDACGLPPREGVLHGRSIVPLLRDPNAAWDHPALTSIRNGKYVGHSIRTERYRYTAWFESQKNDPSGTPAGSELYDHRSDPDELYNLASDQSNTPEAADYALVKLQLRDDIKNILKRKK